MSVDFIFPLNGLAPGRNSFRLRAGKEFFESFENPEILGADLSVAVSIERTGHDFEVDCDLEGTVTVACDRCLEELVVPVDEHPRLRFRFGTEPGEDDGLRELVSLAPSATELDLRQVVYDYACLAVPLHKVHPEGGCNPDTLRYLSSSEECPEAPAEAADSPFAGLRDLFKEKENKY